MSHDHVEDVTVMFTQEYWDARYSSADLVWSGDPNPRLVEHVADRAPGTALDVGSGEGADAIWLSARGWQVTGVDVSTVALDRAAKRAAEAGTEVADRVTWQRADLLSWDPAPRRFDLVSAQFIHLPGPERESLHRRLAAAVRPGGTLLIVGHDLSDLDTSVGRPHFPDLMFTADEVAAVLEPADWQVVVAAAPERQALDPDGRPITIRDAVLLAVRSDQAGPPEGEMLRNATPGPPGVGAHRSSARSRGADRLAISAGGLPLNPASTEGSWSALG